MKFLKPYLPFIFAVIIGIILLAFQQPVTNAINQNKAKKYNEIAKIYHIPQTYNLPEKLNEISGLAWLNNHTFACVQDENGIIFIFDTKQNKITESYKFADSGDYEAIAIINADAYVMRSDGLVYHVENYTSENRKVSEIETPFSKENNIESLTYDTENNRLLTAPKDEDLGDENFKAIYEIPLANQTFDTKPIAKIDLFDDKLKAFRHKKISKTFNPSEIAIHPKTKDIYVLEGKDPKLLILNSTGNLKKVIPLDKRNFPQPEGMTFSEDARLFISNEANNNGATILEVQLK